MSLIDEMRDLLVHEVQWEQRTGVDSHGAPVYAAAVPLVCRVVARPRRVMDATGVERVASATIYLREPHGVQIQDRITLPTGFSPNKPVILAVAAEPDDTGGILERIWS